MGFQAVNKTLNNHIPQNSTTIRKMQTRMWAAEETERHVQWAFNAALAGVAQMEVEVAIALEIEWRMMWTRRDSTPISSKFDKMFQSFMSNWRFSPFEIRA